MEAPAPALILDDDVFQPRAEAMERSELERELTDLHPESWGWALACCARDAELAEEVLQSAYVRILSGRTTFAGRSSFRTWVFGVIRWTARGETRRLRSWWARRADHSAMNGLADSATRADVMAERSDRRQSLLRALRGLSARQREVLQLVFYHDMTIEQAAGVMQVSVGSARTHYERGKKALAARLGAEVDR